MLTMRLNYFFQPRREQVSRRDSLSVGSLELCGFTLPGFGISESEASHCGNSHWTSEYSCLAVAQPLNGLINI